MPRKARATPLRIGGERLLVVSLPSPAAASPALTRAEREIVACLLAGESIAGIAAARRRSPATVGHQVEAIHRKLGVHSRSDLVALLSR